MRYKKYSDEQLIEAAASSYSVANIFRLLGITPTGGNYYGVQKRLKELGVDTSHFTGQAHLRGKKHNWTKKIPLEEILVVNSTYVSTNGLKKRLIREGILEAKCSCCGLTEWNSQPIPLELDHENGDSKDNRIENLRILCPNCHAQTPTYCGKNIKLYRNRPTRRQERRRIKAIKVARRIVSPRGYSIESKKHLRKVERPSLEQLERELADTNYCVVARKYGVSDNCVRKWLKHYKLYMVPYPNAEEAPLEGVNVSFQV